MIGEKTVANRPMEEYVHLYVHLHKSMGDSMKQPLRLMIVLILLWAGQTAYATFPRAKSALEIRPDESESSYTLNNMRVCSDFETPRAVYRIAEPVRTAAPQVMALEYLERFASLYGIESNQLRFESATEMKGRQIVRFRQVVNGTPVYKSDIAITINQYNRVVFVASSLRPGAEKRLASTLSSLSPQAAERIALDYLKVDKRNSLRPTELTVFDRRGEATLCYRVSVVLTDGAYGDWELLIDANGGKILKAIDISCYVDGAGTVFDPDPVNRLGSEYEQTGLVDNNDADNATLTAQLVTRTFPNITLTSGTYYLRNPYAYIYDVESPYNGVYGQTTSTFNYTRGDASLRFEAANVFYHVSTTMTYINTSLGIAAHPTYYTEGMHFDPNGLSGDLNAHYDPSNQSVAFGNPASYVDLAEDNAIIWHEMGHAIHDFITGGNLSQTEGLSEGSSDYWGQSYTHTITGYPSGDPRYEWFGIWGGLPGFSNHHLRTTNGTKHYPEDLVGEVHDDGEIWSAALMQINEVIGRTPTDILLWTALTGTNSSTNQADAAQAVRQADIDLYGGAHLTTIDNYFIARGYYDDPTRPTDLIGSIGSQSAYLRWTAPSNGASSYRLYRNSSMVWSGTATSVTDTGLANGTSYDYYVTAMNGTTESGASNIVTVTPAPAPEEGFESGGFTSFPWTFSGNANWIVDTANSYELAKSAKSGTITHSQTSSMQVVLTVTQASNIAYACKVSSESGYDFLKFYIDGVQQGSSLSGATAWTVYTYAVTTGSHTFNWTYSKDTSVSSGSDCAWVDFIDFPTTATAAYDAELSAINAPLATYNGGNQSITPSVTIKNSGSTTLTSAVVSYRINSGALQSTNWSGTMTGNQTAIVTFPPVTISTGAGQSFVATVSMPNGQADQNTVNDSMTRTFTVSNSSQLLSEGFEGATLPTGWTQEFVTGSTNWSYATGGYNSHPAGAHTGSYNARLYLGSTSGAKTKLVTPAMNFTNMTNNPTVTFWHAQALWSPDQDELRVYYRTSSTGTWTQLAAYTNSITAWTQETITLPSVNSTYYLAFEGYAKYGYGVCVDDVVVNAEISELPMTYSSGDTSQETTTPVYRGETQRQIMQIQLNTAGTLSPLTITQFSLGLNGTTPADVCNARIYSTGSNPVFSATNQFGSTITSPSASYAVTGSQALLTGANYFWLTYDIPATAIVTHYIDATCSGVTVGGILRTPTTTSPAGARQISSPAAIAVDISEFIVDAELWETTTTQLTITNQGNDPLNFNLDLIDTTPPDVTRSGRRDRTAPAWLSASQTSGSIGGFGSLTITFTYNSAGMYEGVYSAEIDVNSNDASAPSIQIPITFSPVQHFLPPTNVRVQIVGGNTVVSWDPVPNANIYHVWYSYLPFSGFNQISDVLPPDTTFIHTGAATQNGVFYRVTVE
jgi:zinc metalloprotease ZmpB